jgi:uncharacterized protein (TIGR03085 family)
VSPSVARLERAALCDLLDEVGPDRPTLCTGWTTRDLAAHLVVRERRPDAAAGLMLKPLAAHLERVRSATALGAYESLVETLRTPPFWSLGALGPLDRATNTLEFFIHHEDVRRAVLDWKPRPLSREYGKALWAYVPGAARLGLRRLRFGVGLTAPGYGTATVGNGAVQAHLTGDPGELALFLSGRQRVADVELTGPEELTAKLRKARLGL